MESDASEWSRRRALATSWRAALVVVLFLGETVALQWLVGAYSSDYAAFASDEAAHFVTSLMLRDFLAQGAFSDPWAFAREYYLHYPKVAIGHWPPLLHTVVAGWMLIGGTSRTAMMLFVAVCAAANACVLSGSGRRLLGQWAGWLGGALFLALPLTQQSSAQLMPEHLVTLLMLLSALQFARFARTGRAVDALAFGALATLAVLTRGSAWALIGVPPFVILLTRRIGLLRSRNLWLSALPVLLVGVPWYVFTRRIWASDGSWIEDTEYFWLWALAGYPLIIWAALGGVIVALVGIGLWTTVVRPRRMVVDPTWAALVALVVATVTLHTVAPNPVADRYMLTVLPPMLLLAAAGVNRLAGLMARRARRELVRPLLAGATAVVSLSLTYEVPTHIHGDGYGALSHELASTYPATERVYLIASNPQGEGALVAALASRESRPGSIVLRASKILTREDWFGRRLEDRFPTTTEVSRLLDQIPVDVVILDTTLPDTERSSYHRRLQAVVTATGPSWRDAGAFPIVRGGQVFHQGLRVYAKRDLASPQVAVNRVLLADLILPTGVR